MDTTISMPTSMLAVLLGWLVILSVVCIYLLTSLLKLKKNSVGNTGNQVVADQEMQIKLDGIARMSKKAIQHLGLVRFNPFKDVGGDQSFAIAFLDGEYNGIIISSIHSRAATRTFAKPIVAGKSLTHDLSQEEEHALELAVTKVRNK